MNNIGSVKLHFPKVFFCFVLFPNAFFQVYIWLVRAGYVIGNSQSQNLLCPAGLSDEKRHCEKKVRKIKTIKNVLDFLFLFFTISWIFIDSVCIY